MLLDRLALDIGSQFTIGETPYEVRGLLTSLPDGAIRGFHLGLTTVISTKGLTQNTELREPMPGLLTQNRYKIMLANGTYDEIAPQIRAQLNDPEWIVADLLSQAEHDTAAQSILITDSPALGGAKVVLRFPRERVRQRDHRLLRAPSDASVPRRALPSAAAPAALGDPLRRRGGVPRAGVVHALRAGQRALTPGRAHARDG